MWKFSMVQLPNILKKNSRNYEPEALILLGKKLISHYYCMNKKKNNQESIKLESQELSAQTPT